jgi:hypothetical protein
MQYSKIQKLLIFQKIVFIFIFYIAHYLANLNKMIRKIRMILDLIHHCFPVIRHLCACYYKNQTHTKNQHENLEERKYFLDHKM